MLDLYDRRPESDAVRRAKMVLSALTAGVLALAVISCDADVEPVGSGGGNGPRAASVSGIGNDTKPISLDSGTYTCVFEWRDNGRASDAAGVGRHARLELHHDNGYWLLHGRGPAARDTDVIRAGGGTYLAEADVGNQNTRWTLRCSR